MLRIILLVLALCVGVSAKEKPLLDLLKLPQKATYYLPKHSLPSPSRKKLKTLYLKQWYSPWVDMAIMQDQKEVFWMQDTLNTIGYKEGGEPYDLKTLQDLFKSMDTAHYPSVAIKAIVVTDSSVRAVPTDMAYYRSKDDYPFDRWQNSMIFAGTPVLITHYNTTKTYAHIQSSFVYGWVKVENLARIAPDTIKEILNFKNYLTPTQDKIPLHDSYGHFVSYAHMGEIFAQVPHMLTQVYTYAKDTNGFVKLVPTYMDSKKFTTFPRPLNTRVMAAVIDTMLGQKYGWGGANQNRDCSAFTRDSFANFGILLPRNSLAQVRYANNMVDLSHMKARNKEAYIIKHATPFATILWLKGHIMLYLGVRHRRAIVAHNVWAISVSRLSKKHTYNIGKAVITTLKLGKEHQGLLAHSNLLIDRIRGMSDLYNYAINLPDTPQSL
ncbi:SH3 domain-containing C40 family peptidase [Helicobacter suis]|uniref:Uncharacterized protein n=1 Tax=Helicobacter suis HS5 TaxID=710394 RepID=E7G2Z3_9HELI|nr:SH3 domain-containing C40 family peptidase [Helicobacter suis]EFX42262.1 hypothetical protein HSUHS5_0294 [Helicobacter suis HS5]EFX43066.1 hypothetical protein HSUHS1_0716 [Helicobacter suis HS1]